MTKIRNPRNLPDDYLMAIGSAIASWANVEFILSQLIHKLANISGGAIYGAVLTTHMSFRQKVQAIIALAELWDAQGKIGLIQLSALKRAVALANKVYDERNKIVHGSWNIDPKGNVELSNLTAKGSPKLLHEYKSVDDLNKLIRKIDIAMLKLFDASGAL